MGVLLGRIASRESSEELLSIGYSCTGATRELLQPFETISSETSGFPTESARKNWSPEALARKDAELLAYEERARVELATALQALVSLGGYGRDGAGNAKALELIS